MTNYWMHGIGHQLQSYEFRTAGSLQSEIPIRRGMVPRWSVAIRPAGILMEAAKMKSKAYFYAGKTRRWTRRDRRSAMWRRWVFMRRIYRYWEQNGINWCMNVREFCKKDPGRGPVLLLDADSWKQLEGKQE